MLRVRKGRVRFRVRCAAVAGCKAEKWRLVYRRETAATINVPALASGKAGTLRAKLSRRTRRALARARSKSLKLKLVRPGRKAVRVTITSR